jgi:hypothetical protein
LRKYGNQTLGHLGNVGLKELALDVSLYTFQQILFVHSFEKVRLSCAFQSVADSNRDPSPANQLNKLDF